MYPPKPGAHLSEESIPWGGEEGDTNREPPGFWFPFVDDALEKSLLLRWDGGTVE